jgi:hypothetical protein
MANHESLMTRLVAAYRNRARERRERRKLDRAYDRGSRELKRQAELRRREGDGER